MKSKGLFSTGVFGILLMMAGQLSFSINDADLGYPVKNKNILSSNALIFFSTANTGFTSILFS